MMWTCRNCGSENTDELKTCAKCGEKNLRPPKGAEVKPRQERKTTPAAVALLNLAAWADAVAGVLVLIGILLNAPTGAFVLAFCTAAVTLTAFAMLKGIAAIIMKL